MEKTESKLPMPELYRPTKIQIGYSPVHYRGIFATDDIEAGEIVERCPIVPLAWRMNYQKDPAVWAYCFTQVCPCEECKRHGGHFIMVLGYGQIYNHQDDNNADLKINMKDQIADVIAKKPIKKGEEIFVSYGDRYFQNREKVTAVTEQKNPGGSCTSGSVFKPL